MSYIRSSEEHTHGHRDVAIFAFDTGLSLVQGMIVVGFFIPLSLFLQGVLTLSPTSTRAMITALSVSLSLGAALVGAIISMRKRYQATTIMGAAIMTLGIFLTMRMTQQTRTMTEQESQARPSTPQ